MGKRRLQSTEKAETINVRVSTKEKRDLQTEAEKAGFETLSAYVRAIVKARPKRRSRR